MITDLLQVQYTPQIPGPHKFHVTYNKVDVPGGDFTVKVCSKSINTNVHNLIMNKVTIRRKIKLDRSDLNDWPVQVDDVFKVFSSKI